MHYIIQQQPQPQPPPPQHQPQQQTSDRPHDLHLTTTTATTDSDDDDDDRDVDSTTSTPPPPDHDDTNNGDMEPWVDWIRRCTHDVEAKMRRLKLDDWITMQRRRKWRWARKVALAPQCDWMAMALRWDPTGDPKLHARRRQGRPRRRWSDDIVSYLTEHTTTTANSDQPVTQVNIQLWIELAQDELSLSSMEDGFCQR